MGAEAGTCVGQEGGREPSTQLILELGWKKEQSYLASALSENALSQSSEG